MGMGEKEHEGEINMSDQITIVEVRRYRSQLVSSGSVTIEYRICDFAISQSEIIQAQGESI